MGNDRMPEENAALKLAARNIAESLATIVSASSDVMNKITCMQHLGAQTFDDMVCILEQSIYAIITRVPQQSLQNQTTEAQMRASPPTWQHENGCDSTNKGSAEEEH